jgi:hypothetical protein
MSGFRRIASQLFHFDRLENPGSTKTMHHSVFSHQIKHHIYQKTEKFNPPRDIGRGPDVMHWAGRRPTPEVLY